MKHKDYKNLCELTIPVVRSIGAFIKSEVDQVSYKDIETKERNSLVSYVDKTAEERLVAALRVIYPSAGFITEEETVEQGEKIATWVIDPLDGTTNFLHGIPHYAVSVALMIDKEIICGIILNAATSQCYYAWKDGGAYADGIPIQVSKTSKISDAIVATGFPYRKDDVGPLLNTFTDVMKEARGVRRMGAAALDLAYVASGRFECYYEASINAWDIAAGILIVREAGGTVTNFGGQEDLLFGGRVLASNGLIHNRMTSVLDQHFR